MGKSYFLHGLDSSGSGTKGAFFRDTFPEVQRPDFTGDLAQRLRQLEELVSGQEQLFFIGSSFGGLMATCFACSYPERVLRLVLLAPALNYGNFTPPREKITVPTLLVIGRRDEITPAEKVLPLAEASFSRLEIRLENDDHLLHDSFAKLDWQQLLGKGPAHPENFPG